MDPGVAGGRGRARPGSPQTWLSHEYFLPVKENEEERDNDCNGDGDDSGVDHEYNLYSLSQTAREGVPEDERRLNCTRTHLKGPYKREGNREFNPFTTEEQLLMTQAVKRVNQTVQLLGYQPLPHYSIIT
ncbi:hypothetical protein Pcinc_040744 [Petrolisthes cinctipes]|uniref:Uncharacterized protein n=1 Tax=Petrolisthes cinctipes TaxID=88211 RepID=A0AAE1BM99_PETCI|nr:hypothetical protein Pcinc_040744 [Petrolisthes cinctipes]